MKKIVVLFLFLFLFFSLPCFAEYKPIPKELSVQYKADMEQIINKEYPNIIKNVDKCVNHAEKLYNKVIKYGYFSNNQMDVINLCLISEHVIFASDLDLYAKLMKVTQEKYLGIKYEPLGVDYTAAIDRYLCPYFRDNNVDTTLLVKIVEYESKQNKIIEHYIRQAEKLRPIED